MAMTEPQRKARNTLDDLTFATASEQVERPDRRYLGEPTTAGPSIDWEQVVGRRGALWMGAALVFLAMAFFLSWAWQSLGPWGRVTVGALVGAAFVGAGEWASDRKDKTFSAGLAGAGMGTTPASSPMTLMSCVSAGTTSASIRTGAWRGFHQCQIAMRSRAWSSISASTGRDSTSGSPISTATGSRHASQGSPPVVSDPANSSGNSYQ